MTEFILFPFFEYWPLYVGFFVLVLALLALDLGVFHRSAHEVSFRESLIWSCVWITLAVLFNVGLYFLALRMAPEGADAPALAKQISFEFFTAYLIEKSLSVDNLFIFSVVFSYFAVPLKYQHRVLFYGILGALVFRAIFISLGAALMKFEFMIWIFGAFLIFTGLQMALAGDKKIDPEHNFLIRLLKRVVPVTSKLEGPRFFTVQDGRLWATPLFVCLLFLEFTDVIFAVDSVPAIFAITKDPFVVLTSNVFAILGLRSLYFMLAGVMDRFEYLKYGLAAVLVFVGLKMTWLNHLFGGKFPVLWSLGIVFGLISSAMLGSWWLTRRRHRLQDQQTMKLKI